MRNMTIQFESIAGINEIKQLHTIYSISNSQVTELLKTVIPKIVREVSLRKIILSYSIARNESNKNSDIDLLIGVKDGIH